MVRHLKLTKAKKSKIKKAHVEKAFKDTINALLADLKLLGKDIRKKTLDTADIIFKSAKTRLARVGHKKIHKPIVKVTTHTTEKMKSAME